jgi:hypothetical protein
LKSGPEYERVLRTGRETIDGCSVEIGRGFSLGGTVGGVFFLETPGVSAIRVAPPPRGRVLLCETLVRDSYFRARKTPIICHMKHDWRELLAIAGLVVVVLAVIWFFTYRGAPL